jgi:hypothetical protein
MLSRNASCPVEFVLKYVILVPLPEPSGFVRVSKTKLIVAFSPSSAAAPPSVIITE